MPAPHAIIDGLESVLEILFSGVRHRERAAFILCDNLVEMTCKTRAHEHDHHFNFKCSFHAAWNAPGVTIDPAGLGARINGYHTERNNLQHGNAAATVDQEHCATAICDAAGVIENCWPGTVPSLLAPRIRHGLRIATLYSSNGDVALRPDFERVMNEKNWCVHEREIVRSNGRQIEPGKRDFWYIAIRMQGALVDECLNELGL